MSDDNNPLLWRITFESIQDALSRVHSELQVQRSEISKVVEVLQKIAVTEEKLVAQARINQETHEALQKQDQRIRDLEQSKDRARGWFDIATLVWAVIGGVVTAIILKYTGGG